MINETHPRGFVSLSAIEKALKGEQEKSKKTAKRLMFIGLCGLLGITIGSIRKEVSERREENEIMHTYAIPRNIKMDMEEHDGKLVSVYKYKGRAYEQRYDPNTNTVTLVPYETK